MKTIGWKTAFLFKALEKTKFGRIQINFRNGPSYEFGDGDLISQLDVANESVVSQVLSRGDIGLAEAITSGDLFISNQAGFVEWACLNDDLLRQAFHGSFLGTIIPHIQKWFRPNTKVGAQKNIMAHYDLGNEFYKLWLDKSMSYSSAIYSKQAQEDLHQAQMVKYDRIIDELNIRSGDTLLEIGCGWGGFFSRAIEKTGCHVTAVLNSPAQHSHNQELISERKYKGYIDLQLKDYREIQGQFNKIVSIEMIEAVGQKYWPQYFSKVRDSLKSGGEALIQSITIRDDRFEDYSRTTDFIKQYIFPGGMLLSNEAMKQQASLVDLQPDQPFEFGQSYAETLKQWRINFLQHTDEYKKFGLNKEFLRLWEFYLNYCEGAFRSNRINVGHFVLSKPKTA